MNKYKNLKNEMNSNFEEIEKELMTIPTYPQLVVLILRKYENCLMRCAKKFSLCTLS